MTVLDQLSPNPVMLAPMVGLSHIAVRMALQGYLAPGLKALWPTEMLSSHKLPRQNRGETPEIRFDDFEAGLCPQLLGNDEKLIRESVEKLVSWGARAIDINMGCPVTKALKHNYGVALMGDQDFAANVVHWTKAATHLPVSVKLRSGFEEKEHRLEDFVSKLVAAGASWITLHPRSAEQKRRGEASWLKIKDLKSFVKVPIVGNGDIQNVQDVHRMLAETGCDRVMVGRALMAKPWLMSLNTDLDAYDQGNEYGNFLKRVLHLSESFFEEAVGMRKMRFLIYHGSPWLEFGHTLFSQANKAKTYPELRSVLERFFLAKHSMSESSHFRK